MELKIIEDIAEVKPLHPIVYFSQSYLISQQHHQFVCYQTANIQLMIVVSDNLAISIPRSPFGSFSIREGVSEGDFQSFIVRVKEDLSKRNVSQLVIHHPSEIYDSFVSEGFLRKAGFDLTYNDTNQHIPLANEWKSNLHKMQVKKLQSLYENGFAFRKMEHSELEIAHQFISACRQVQGLTINIEWEHLKNLQNATHAYESFGVFREGRLSAVCITAKVSKDVVYYYLPATSPTFRTESPMVMLIEGMVEHYIKEGYKNFDMGASSLMGKSQESLVMFKERMGAVSSKKPTFSLSI